MSALTVIGLAVRFVPPDEYERAIIEANRRLQEYRIKRIDRRERWADKQETEK